MGPAPNLMPSRCRNDVVKGTQRRRMIVLFIAPCPKVPWGIDWLISIAPGCWCYVSWHRCYCGARRGAPGGPAVNIAQREHCAAPNSGNWCWPAAKVALQVWLCHLTLFWSPCWGQTAPAQVAAKQRGARARTTRAARTRQASAPLSISITFPFLVLSLFVLLSLPGSPIFPGRGQW